MTFSPTIPLPPPPERLFQTLFSAFGPQHWWPANSIEEMMVGAVLVQNTAWTQVTKALDNLKEVNGLAMVTLRELPEQQLWALIRPAGYFRVKTQRLKSLATFLATYEDNLDRLFDHPTATLRQKLLAVHGIGPETADSILCYGANRAVFVVDAYTKRLFMQLGWVGAKAGYHEMQALVQRNFPENSQQLGEFHALIVRQGKEICRPRPRCPGCPVSYCRQWQSAPPTVRKTVHGKQPPHHSDTS